MPVHHATLYVDRKDAGKRLAPLLLDHKGGAAIVFAVPSG
jgi:hypothetical protein